MRKFNETLCLFALEGYTYLIMKIRYFFLLLTVFLAACTGLNDNTVPTPTQISFPAPNQPSNQADPQPENPVSDDCQPNAALLEDLRNALPYEQAVVTPISYGGENTLLVWFASPELSKTPVQQTEDAAITQAVQAASTLLGTSICVAEFNSLVLNVVDENYQLWFSGSVRVADIPNLSLEDGSGGGNGNESEGAGRGPIEPPPGQKNTCTWVEASNALDKTFSTPENQAVFYFIREGGTSTVNAHWQVSTLPSQEEALATLTAMAPKTQCIYPPATGLSATLTGPDGQIRATAYLPLNKNGKPQENKFSYTPLD